MDLIDDISRMRSGDLHRQHQDSSWQNCRPGNHRAFTLSWIVMSLAIPCSEQNAVSRYQDIDLTVDAFVTVIKLLTTAFSHGKGTNYALR